MPAARASRGLGWRGWCSGRCWPSFSARGRTPGPSPRPRARRQPARARRVQHQPARTAPRTKPARTSRRSRWSWRTRPTRRTRRGTWTKRPCTLPNWTSGCPFSLPSDPPSIPSFCHAPAAPRLLGPGARRHTHTNHPKSHAHARGRRTLLGTHHPPCSHARSAPQVHRGGALDGDHEPRRRVRTILHPIPNAITIPNSGNT